MAPATLEHAAKFTYDDYRTAPEDRRYELLDGDLIVAPAPSLKHQRVLLALAGLLDRFVKEAGLGEVLPAPCDVVLSDTDVVQPDLLFISREREHLVRNGDNVQGAPDLVVEILSPATADRDRGYKRALYAKHGVAEYWLVDPVAETITVHLPDEGSLVATQTRGRGETLRSPTLRGFEANPDDIFPTG